MKNYDLGKEKISKLLLNFSIPCIISMLVGALYNIVDQIFIGWGVGYLGNTATNIVYPFTVIALSLALLFGDGASALFSLSLGSKDDKKVSKSIGNAVITLVLVSLVLTLFGFIFKSNILKLFGVTEASFDFANDYLTVILIGIPFYVIGQGLNGIIRADGSPRYAMIATLSGAILNIILDPIAIFALGMGIKGAAIATIVGQIITFILTVLYFRKSKKFKLSKDSLKPDKEVIKREALLGVSSFITQISIVLVIAVCNNLVVKYGSLSKYGADIPLSAIGIVMKVFGIVIALVIGTSIGGQPIIGYNYGAGNEKRVKETFKLIIRTNLIVGIVSFVIFQVFPQAIINIFGSESELYNEYALYCFRIYLSGITLTCITKTCSIYLQAIGKSFKSMFISVMRDVVLFIPALVVLAKMFGVVGMLWAALVADVIAFIIAIFMTFERKNKVSISEVKNISEVDAVFIKPMVITISREYGSGGRYVGKLLAEKLGIPCYDKEIIVDTAKESGLDIEYIKENEQIKNDFNIYYNNDDNIYLCESKVIKNLAMKPCIIIGRCADYILKDRNDVYNVFLYSSMDKKIDRVTKYYGIDAEKAKNEINKVNKRRAIHYEYYTNQKWNDVGNYDLAVNVDTLGVENTALMIKNIIENGK